MNEYSAHRGNDAMFGFMFGALVGAAAALLLAPASGEDTRRKLGETTRRLREQGGEIADKARHKFDQMREQGEEIADKARNKFDQMRHEPTGARGTQGPQGV